MEGKRSCIFLEGKKKKMKVGSFEISRINSYLRSRRREDRV